MEQPQQAAQGLREFPAAGREDVFQRALVGFAPGAQLGVGLMQLGEILLQGLDGLLLVSRSLFQLVEVLLLADAGLLEILYALENGGEQWVVSQRLQREVAVAHAQLHPCGETVQTIQHEIRVVVEEQDAVAVERHTIHRAAEDAVIREDEIGDAAGQFAGVETEIERGLRQLECCCHHAVQLVVFVVRGFDGVFLGKAEPGIIVKQRLHQSRRVGLPLFLGVGSIEGLQLFFQLEAALGQPRSAFVCKFELLFKVRNAAAQSRFRSFVHHYRGLLRFIARRTTRAASPCIKSNYSLPSKWLDTKAQEFQCFAA